MESSEEKNNSERDSIDKEEFIRLMNNKKFLLGSVLVYAGVALTFLLKSQYDLKYFFEKIGPITLGVVAISLGFLILYGEVAKVKKFKRGNRFIDIDDNRDCGDQVFQKRILDELNSIKAKSASLSINNIEQLISKIVETKCLEQINMFDSFENYFNEVRRVLLEQAYTSDKKASILLDKGTSYSKGGIVFFITSIILWQVLAIVTGFKEQYIYGIVSCSLLFIFIEFLSAWFLKQYRHFVDTSTYHIKVKSIFDKYMMSYLAIKSLGDKNHNEEAKYQAMLKILEEDIKWPESYLLKKSEVSFAKEAIETMSLFAKAIKSEAKGKGSDKY